ncbi:putative signal transducing protein [Ancylobacter terrae]|uniref:putative signal transducing protein n=1 Tax=Ancylobacter sp. sgz301288 TaxID=3342077 RepID=UPI00385A15D2
MRELMRTNDLVLISAVEALLQAAGIGHYVADSHMSALEGSIGLLPRRLLVEDDEHVRARRLLAEAGLRHVLVD